MSGGAGLVAQYDSRDNENMPTQGWLLNLNNMAYRESLGGDDDFDVYRAEIRYYMAHGKGNVLAVRQLNHFTDNAPTQVNAPVFLRGYKVGQYNGKYMSHIEVEERWRFARGNGPPRSSPESPAPMEGARVAANPPISIPPAEVGSSTLSKPRKGLS